MNIVKYMVIGGLLLVVAGCSSENKKIGGSGLIETDDVIVSAQTSGQSLELFFDEGWVVKEGAHEVLIETEKGNFPLPRSRFKAIEKDVFLKFVRKAI